MSFKINGKEKELNIQLHKEGKYDTNYSKYKLNLIGLPFKVKTIQIDNVEVVFDKVVLEKSNSIVIDKEFSTLQIIG